MENEGLHAWFDGRAASGDFSGVALVRRDGETVFEHAVGLASRAHGVPVTLASRFAVASVTKMPVAVAALRLAERGLLDLHRPLLEILPPGQRTAAMTRAHTTHHLLAQTSGLANYHDDADETWASFTASWDRVATYHARTPADMLPLFADLPARRPPGEAYEYSDANFILVGLVIEAVTGRSWADVVTEEVFGPAGMVDTETGVMDADPARLAVGYMTDDGPVGLRRTNIYSVSANGMPDGGMITTAHDLAALVEALLGGKLLAPATLAAMISSQAPPSDDLEQYGYGCLLTVEDGRVTSIGHGGSDPGVSCMVVHHLAARTTLITLCNQDRGSWAATKELSRAFGLHEARA